MPEQPNYSDDLGCLMAAAQKGNAEAYERLLRQLLPPLRAFIIRRLRDSSASEDVVQNVLLSIHRARHSYTAGRPFEPWFWTIARNATVDALRKRTQRLQREASLEGLELAGDGLRRLEAASPLTSSLRSALGELPAAQREAVELIHLHQLSVREAASRLGVTPGALKVRAHRGYKALRLLLAERPA